MYYAYYIYIYINFSTVDKGLRKNNKKEMEKLENMN